jgi:hypothetical protein
VWNLILWGGIAVVAAATVLFSVLVGKIREAKRTSTQPQCYYCGNPAVRLSAPNGILDWILENWNCVPHRCEVCFRRHYRFLAGNTDDV